MKTVEFVWDLLRSSSVKQVALFIISPRSIEGCELFRYHNGRKNENKGEYPDVFALFTRLIVFH